MRAKALAIVSFVALAGLHAQGRGGAQGVRLTVEMKNGLKTASIWGVLPGLTDENIAVMAHTDAFFEGAMDNASGMATMVALAEYYASVPKSKRRRTMTFFTTSAHHSPSGPNASLRWIHTNRSEEHTSELQSLAYLVCRLLLEKKKKQRK